MPNKLTRFWQELKRRKVIHVITVYAGVAFVVIELINNITEPLRLPEWTPTLVITLLFIGFPIAVIFSWIYDIHPEGGIIKTKPAHEVKSDEIPKSSSSWKIASYISFIVIVGLIVLNIIPRTGNKEILDKSIAVLPLEYLSENPDKEYLANGVLDAITGHLSMIEGLRVMPRTSVEQYRDNKKSAKEIGEELGVSYLIEGSFLMVEDSVKLTIQLVVAEEGDHILFKEYDREYKDIFAVQSEVAQTIAKEIEVVITPEEKQRIEKAPTTSLVANELYQMGREEYIKFLLNVRDRDALTRAQEYYMKALGYDSTFAKACAGVAMTFHSSLVVREKLDAIYSKDYINDNAFDTVFFWANKALNLDKQLPEAYYIRGNYYFETGNRVKAEEDFHKAIQLNSNYWEAYYGLGNMYTSIDYIKVFENFQKAASLVRGPELSYILMLIIQSYLLSGNIEEAESPITDYVNLTQDSLLYYMANYYVNLFNENPENQHYWLTKAYAYDSTDPTVLSYLAESYIKMGRFEEGLKYYKQSDDINNKLDRISYNRLHRIGYAFTLAGQKEEAGYYFDRAEKIYKSIIRLNRPRAFTGSTHYDLALIYAFRGEKSKAMEILRNLHQRSTTPYIAAWYMQWDPMLDGIRDDPEFQQIANDLGLKWRVERERVKQWLEENDML